MNQLPSQLDPLSGDSLHHLHRGAISGTRDVSKFLDSLHRAKTRLSAGFDFKSRIRSAKIEAVHADRVDLQVENIEFQSNQPIYFDFEFEGLGYFLVASPRTQHGAGSIEISIPAAVYKAERRDLSRETVSNREPSSHRVEFRNDTGRTQSANLRDVSYHGLSLALSEEDARRIRFPLELQFIDGERRGESVFAELKNTRSDSQQRGWVRLGMAISKVPNGKLIEVERQHNLLGGGKSATTWRTISFAGAVARGGSARIAKRLGRTHSANVSVDVVEYPNNRGQRIAAIVNHTGNRRGAPVVVIPPAWGRTKETMLPLAATMIRMFEKAGEPLVVLRFDGTNRRGESYIDPRFVNPGDEYLGFRFSQAVEDITSSFDFLEKDERFTTDNIVLLTVSMGAVEGRRSLARELGERVKGWLALVGMADLQSGMRTVSGGVNYAHGLMNGVKFGFHELMGVKADMDFTGKDVMEHRLAYLEDAKRDMEQIDIPITWLHGRDDGWMELPRVQSLLSAGNISKRRLIEVPTGHQLRNSRQALETFQLCAREVSTMFLGKSLEPVLPDLVALDAHSQAERARRPKSEPDLRIFWADYLLGRDRTVGIEVLTATAAYRQFMILQIEKLALEPSQHALDLGSGAGDFPLLLSELCSPDAGLRVTQVDFVTEALKRGRRRLARHPHPAAALSATTAFAADLDISAETHIPLADEVADAALLSLLVSYLGDPETVIREVARVLRPGGRLVVSSMHHDADISRIFLDGIAEFPPDRIRSQFPDTPIHEPGDLPRRFLSSASNLLQLEEEGRFRFWDADELVELVEAAGFEQVGSEDAFGSPPQAVVVTAIRRA